MVTRCMYYLKKKCHYDLTKWYQTEIKSITNLIQVQTFKCKLNQINVNITDSNFCFT